jgi:hypothetical protein
MKILENVEARSKAKGTRIEEMILALAEAVQSSRNVMCAPKNADQELK